jgi:hypothetical protein
MRSWIAVLFSWLFVATSALGFRPSWMKRRHAAPGLCFVASFPERNERVRRRLETTAASRLAKPACVIPAKAGIQPWDTMKRRHKSGSRSSADRETTSRSPWVVLRRFLSGKRSTSWARPRNNCCIATGQASICHPRQSGDPAVGHDEATTKPGSRKRRKQAL